MFQLRTILVCLLIGASVTSCSWKKPSMTYTYTDQNNNRYYISNTKMRYLPIKASESSSGDYNGGDPTTISITEAQFAEIIALAEAVWNATTTHTQKREMLTSVLSSTSNGKSRRVTLTRSKARTAFENYLNTLKK